MSHTTKTQTLGSKFNDINNIGAVQFDPTGNALAQNGDDFTTIFRQMQISALTKAVNITPNVKSKTLGNNSTISSENNLILNETVNNEVSEGSIPHCSTPKRNLSQTLASCSKFMKLPEKEQNLVSTSNENGLTSGSPYCQKKLLQEYDFQRRLKVDEIMRQRIQNMYERGKLIRDSLEHLKQTRQEEAITRRMLQESKIISDIQELEILNKPKREAQWEKDNLKEAQRILERNQRVKEAEEEAKKKSEAILQKKLQIDKILFELQKDYNQEYKDILETFKLCKDKVALTKLTSTHSKTLRDCATLCESILRKCKQGDIKEEDVKNSKKLVETIKSVHKAISTEITRINEVKQIEVVQKTKEEKNNLVTEANKPQLSEDLSDCYDAQSYQTYTNLRSKLESFEKDLQPLMSDESMKKFKFNCQKAVTIPVNAISPISASHLIDKYMKLHHLLLGKPVEVGEIKINASQHPLGIAFCKNLLAKKFVRQGDLTVSSKPDAAFSLAAVLTSLWVDFPDFGQLVLAHFHLACPYLAPVFMPQVEGQSDEDYYKSLGYHYSQNGGIEKQDIFLKRMSGIMRLYAALLISKPRQSGKTNPLGLSEGWRWISALLNLDPRPDICATLLYDFLEVAGNQMFRVYGAQFKKLLAYICQEYFPKLEKVTSSNAGGPIVRLEGFLQKILKEESIPQPHGALPYNFW